jgi:hypothetical protein
MLLSANERYRSDIATPGMGRAMLIAKNAMVK